jgi:CheY-like chemotaxis protein
MARLLQDSRTGFCSQGSIALFKEVKMLTTTPRTAQTRVLVIEDQTDTRESLRILLSIHGCDVRVAGDALEGVRQAADWQPEVVISDIGLPGLDGWELGRQMRARLGEKAFLVAVSGYAQPADQQRSHEAGYDVHLNKPADVKALLRLIGI